MFKEVTKFQALDGSVHESIDEAIRHSVQNQLEDLLTDVCDNWARADVVVTARVLAGIWPEVLGVLRTAQAAAIKAGEQSADAKAEQVTADAKKSLLERYNTKTVRFENVITDPGVVGEFIGLPFGHPSEVTETNRGLVGDDFELTDEDMAAAMEAVNTPAKG